MAARRSKGRQARAAAPNGSVAGQDGSAAARSATARSATARSAAARSAAARSAAARDRAVVVRGGRAVHAESRSQVAEIQRARLLVAAVGALEEHGYKHTSVTHVTTRARVSRRTFYDLFANREECIAAVLEDTAAQLLRELRDVGVGDLAWRERMRLGLWTILCFLEREPALGRALVMHSVHGSGRVVQAREAILAQLVAAVDAGRREAPATAAARGARARNGSAATGPSELTAEGVVGGVLAILHARLAHEPPRLSALLGELCAIVLLPYQGPAVARREQARPAPATLARGERAAALLAAPDPLAGLPMRITYRTTRVLGGIAACPGLNNRQAAEHAGIADQGQVSKLLARLRSLGLIDNGGVGHAKGEPNAWSLTTLGEQVIRRLGLTTTAVAELGHAKTHQPQGAQALRPSATPNAKQGSRRTQRAAREESVR